MVLLILAAGAAEAGPAGESSLPAHWTVHPYPPRSPTEGVPSNIQEGSLRFYNYFLHGGNRSWAQEGPGAGSLQILVAGAGTGDATLEFAAQISQAKGGRGLLGAQVTHFEQSLASVATARQRVEHFGLEQWVTFVVGDLRELDRLTGHQRYDIINCVGVLHHIAEPLPVLRGLSAALRDDGGMLLMVYGTHGRNGVREISDAVVSGPLAFSLFRSAF